MLAVTADELLIFFREDVSDDAGYSADNDDVMLWKDSEIYRYMTAAASRLAKDTDGLFKVVRLSYTADDPVVILPSYVMKIREMRDVTFGRKLIQYNANSVESSDESDYGTHTLGSSAMFDTTGQPAAFVGDYEKKHLRLVPIPTTDGVLEAQCMVTIQKTIEQGDPLPFLDIDEQMLMLEYMKYLAYRKQDAETEDLTRSAKAKAAYDAGIKERKHELQRRRRTPGVVRMHGWDD